MVYPDGIQPTYTNITIWFVVDLPLLINPIISHYILIKSYYNPIIYIQLNPIKSH